MSQQHQQRLQTCGTCHHQTARSEKDSSGKKERLSCTAKGCGATTQWKVIQKPNGNRH